jgi:CheY-like chemotaxis protein
MVTKILIIDDDFDYIEQMKMQLEAAGYEVVTASSAAEGKETLNSIKPDAAVVDLMLEDVDGGFTLCYLIKKMDESIPVILVTAVAGKSNIDFDAATSEERAWIKADVVLDKPVRFEQLDREIKRLLPEKST